MLQFYSLALKILKSSLFRLIQPDEKPHKGLFRWGSGRFRYQGRTHFQSKMASQMFDHPAATVKRSHSARLASRSDENRVSFFTAIFYYSCRWDFASLSLRLTVHSCQVILKRLLYATYQFRMLFYSSVGYCVHRMK